MQECYNQLSNQDKAYYDIKMTNIKQVFNENADQFRKIRDDIDLLFSQHAREQQNTERPLYNAANEQLIRDNRDRLLKGVDEIQKADGQIERIKGTAIETHQVMIEANRELHDQGKIIEEA